MKFVKFSEIKSRITGFSVPVFGISWNPTPAEVTVARRVIAFLEDRRVLFAPSEMEDADHCVQSILQIRHELTAEIQQLPAESDLSGTLRGMRAACRKFLEVADEKSARVYTFGGFRSWVFNQALGELRGALGLHVAKLATQYGLDVEADLATILPVADTDDVLGGGKAQKVGGPPNKGMKLTRPG